jgi:hypothetical protein
VRAGLYQPPGEGVKEDLSLIRPSATFSQLMLGEGRLLPLSRLVSPSSPNPFSLLMLSLTPFLLSQPTPALREQVLGEGVSAPFSHHQVGEGPGMRESAAIE